MKTELEYQKKDFFLNIIHYFVLCHKCFGDVSRSDPELFPGPGIIFPDPDHANKLIILFIRPEDPGL